MIPGELGRQWGRVARLRVMPVGGAPLQINPPIPPIAGVRQPDLRITFEVSKSLTPEPQRGSVTVSNLAKTTRDAIATAARRPEKISAAGLTVDGRAFVGSLAQLEAGYLALVPSSLILGNLSSARSRHAGTEWITTVAIGDNEAAITQAECRRTFNPGATALEVLSYAVQCMGMRLAAAPIPAAISAYVLSRGYTAYGRAFDTVNAILAGVAPDLGQLGFVAQGVSIVSNLYDAFTGVAPLTRPIGWWSEDGEVYFLERGRALPAPAMVTSADGTVGAITLLERPERLEDGAVRIVTLLHPFRIGRPVTILSRELAGIYRAERVVHRGDTRGGNFTTTTDLRILVT